MTGTRRAIRRLLQIGGIALVAAGIAYIAREPILLRIGSQLIREDRLARADAIVVLGGGTPLSEIEAADLYLAGYAPRVLLTIEREPRGAGALRERGVEFERRIDLRKRILQSLGVPDTALTILDQRRVNSTMSEAELVREWASAGTARRIIVVTSRYHTARASLVFRRRLASHRVDVLVRSAATDPFRSHDWWKDRDELRNGLFEWQKLVFYYVAYR